MPQKQFLNDNDENPYDDEDPLPSNDVYDQPRSVSQGADDMISRIDASIGQNRASADELHGLGVGGAKPGGSKDANNPESDALGRLGAGIAGGGQLGRGYTNQANTWADTKKALKSSGGVAGIAREALRFVGNKAKNNKKVLGGVGLGGGVTAGAVGLFMSVLPFGYTSIMNNVVSEKFKTANTDMSEMQESLASHLIKKYILPGMKLNNCQSTLTDKNCAVPVEGDGPVQRLLRAQLKAHIDNMWAKQGFELRYNRANGKYFIRSSGIKGDIDISKYLGTDQNLFREIGRDEVRGLFQEVHKRATFWNRLIVRVGWSKKTLKQNYGQIRCIRTCKVLDFSQKYFKEPLATRRQAFKIMRYRLLLGKSSLLGLALTCMTAGSDCDPNKPNIDPETGEYHTKFEKDIQGELRKLATQSGGDVALKTIEDMTKSIREKGFQRYAVEEVAKALIGKLGGSEGAKQATGRLAGSAVPGVNMVLGFSDFISTLSSIGTKAKSLNTEIQIATAVAVFALNTTYNDEIKSGNVDGAEAGSFAAQFDRNQQKLLDGSMGGADAATTPLYHNVIHNGATTTAFNSLFGAKTYAADTSDPSQTKAYHCPISNDVLDPAGQDGKLICPEQSLKYSSMIVGVFGSISSFLNLPGISVITEAANFISGVRNSLSGIVSDKFIALVEKLPGYNDLLDKISKASDPIVQDLVKYVFPSWYGDNNSGGTNFIATVLGATATANQYTEQVLRGGVLTPQQSADIINDANHMEEIQFKSKPLYARIFDKEDNHSFVTQLSLALPSDIKTQTGSMVAQLISDPFSKIVRTFGAIFTGQRAFAAQVPSSDPFGLPTMGIPLSDAVFHSDPEVYYTSRCTDPGHSNEWNNSVVIDDDLGIPVHTQSDPCGLMDESIQVGGGLFDSKLAGQ